MNVRETTFDIHVNSLRAASLGHPTKVLENPILFPAEKRCILAAWASDTFAVRDNPWLRQLPGSPDAIALKDILGALRRLDQDDG